MALLRQGWIGLIGDVVAFGPPLWRYVVKPILGLLSLGGDIDFSIEHWGKPGWVGDMLVPFGHPIFQFILIAIGLSLIYFDTRRRAGTNVSYPAIGMTLSAVVFAGFFIAWIWPSPATKTQNKSLAWVFSGMAGKSDANGFRVSDVQFLAAKNETGKAVRLVDAYIQSSIDGGKKRPLLLNTYEHGLVPLSQANPIPPNTENITLMAEFPELSESEFMKDWGNISFVIQDSDQAFQGKVDEQTFRGVFDGYRPKAPPPRATASASLENKRYWLPLADDEAAKLRSKLRGLTQEPLSIWCNGDNCRDIAETVQAAFQQSNWGDPQIEESIFPLNFVGVHVAPDTEKTRALANAIEEATAGRIIVKVEPEPTNDKMINIMFGRKR